MTIPERAVKTFGPHIQIQKLAEEASELAVACHHANRGEASLEALFEEAADVEVVIESLRAHYGDDRFDAWRARKLLRLEGRLNKATPQPKPEPPRPEPDPKPRASATIIINGRAYPTQAKAAEVLGISQSNLSTKIRHCKGSFVHEGKRVQVVKQ